MRTPTIHDSEASQTLKVEIRLLIKLPQTEQSTSTSMNLGPILVVGATGATGRHVVQQLLDQGRQVRAIVRSKERMLSLVKIPETASTPSGSSSALLSITEASLLDLSDDELYEHVKGAEAVVACLGHNLSFEGMFGHPRRLVRDSVTRLSKAMIRAAKESGKEVQPSKPKLIVMGTVGVPNPDGTDDPRRFFDRLLLKIFLYALPPHIDNEETAQYVHSLGKDSGIEWAVVRPTDLIDGEVSPFKLYDKPQGSLFGDGLTTRANVAKAMVDFIVDNELWEKYKFSMPTIYNKKAEAPSGDAKKEL
jgi:nucleoside-diphosphate-sugar epimerase